MYSNAVYKIKGKIVYISLKKSGLSNKTFFQFNIIIEVDEVKTLWYRCYT